MLANFGSFFGIDGLFVLGCGVVTLVVVGALAVGLFFQLSKQRGQSANLPHVMAGVAVERICKECGTLIPPSNQSVCPRCGGRLVGTQSPIGAELRSKYHGG